jgi:ABC-type branched-subunit amino acid transport system ATPase component
MCGLPPRPGVVRAIQHRVSDGALRPRRSQGNGRSEASLKLLNLDALQDESARKPPLWRPAASGDRTRTGNRAELLLLDEPAAGMNPQESADLMRLIGVSAMSAAHHFADRARL